RSLLFAGLISELVACGEALLQEAGDDRSLEGWVLRLNLAVGLFSVGRWPEAAAWYQREIQRAREDRQLDILGWDCAIYARDCAALGDAEVALDHARQGAEIADKVRDPALQAFAYRNLGYTYLRVRSYAEAVTALERAREFVEESHTAFEFEPEI